MKKNRKNLQQDGFTLLEVMIVLFILVTLAGLAVVAVTGQQKEAQRKAAFTYVHLLKGAMNRYTLDVGRPADNNEGLGALINRPADAGTWGGPYLEVSATDRDPWGNQYQYASPGKDGRDFDIWSFGPDRMDGTADDIGSWMNELPPN